MEKLIETVELTTQDGRKAVFEVIQDTRTGTTRAYGKGSSAYYEMPVFEAGLKKAASVVRTPA